MCLKVFMLRASLTMLLFNSSLTYMLLIATFATSLFHRWIQRRQSPCSRTKSKSIKSLCCGDVLFENRWLTAFSAKFISLNRCEGFIIQKNALRKCTCAVECRPSRNLENHVMISWYHIALSTYQNIIINKSFCKSIVF